MQSFQRKTAIALSVLLGLASINAMANKSESSNTPFYQDKERGWFWHESLEEEQARLEKEAQSQQAPEETIELSTQWVKEALPKLMEKAINDPSDANLANYAYAQRLMLDQASRFSSRMNEFMLLESQLDESNRRPTAGFALNAFNEERNIVVGQAIAEIKKNSRGLFFFYASDCSFCHRMIPVLNEFQKRHKIEILAISLDGGVIPGMENFQVVADVEMEVANRFNVSITPTIHLVMPNNEAEQVLVGLKPLPELEDKLLFASRKAGLLTSELYAKTRGVREINVFKNQEGNLIADKARIENDPEYLAELLRMQLSDSEPAGTRIMKR